MCYGCPYCIAGKRGHLTCITLQRLRRKGRKRVICHREELAAARNTITPAARPRVRARPSKPQVWASSGQKCHLQEQNNTKNWFSYKQGRFIKTCIAGEKIIQLSGITTFHDIWQTRQTPNLHLSGTNYEFLSLAHINSQSLGNICVCSGDATSVTRLVGNCSQHWAVAGLYDSCLALHSLCLYQT